MTEQRTSPEQLAEGRRLLAAASDGPWHARQYRDGEWTLRERGEDGRGFHIAGFALNREDAEVCAWLRNAAEALFDDAEALAGARAECERLRAALATIQQWDCLNPPNTGLCEDFPWLRELVDTALAPGTGGVARE